MSEHGDELMAVARRRIGTVLRGKYRIDAVLGVGGMAVVYKATHRNEAEFALKMLHPELSIRDDVRTRFLREGKAANSVKHPGAVLVVDDDVAEDGAAFLVMELIDGIGVESLWERCRHRLPPRAALAIGHQLLDVLAAAHAKGIIHRDIKPANLFLTREGVVKVLDFGIARVRDAAASGAGATSTGMLLGTPAFMPPEQALAKMSEIDGRTDVWAAGATLFSLVTGQYVHRGENAPQLMVQAATVQARSLATAAPDAPPALVQVVDRALAFDRQARWPTAQAMRDAVAEAYRVTFADRMSREPLAAFFSEEEAAITSTLPPVQAPSQQAAPLVRVAIAPTLQSDDRVSAGPPPQHSPPARPVVVAPYLSPAASAPLQGLPSGGTTAQPVSSGPVSDVAGVPKRGSSGRTVGIAAAVLLLAGVGAAGLRVAKGDHAAAAGSASETPLVVAPAATPSATVSSAPALPAPAASSVATTAMPSPSSHGVAPHGQAAPPVPGTATHGATSASTAPVAPAPPSPPPAAAPSCRAVLDHYDGNYQPVYRQDCH